MIGYSRAFEGLYGPKSIEGKSKMNQRIQELEKQCYGYASLHDDTIVFDRKKFAELIVRDCISQVDNLNHNSGDEWDKAMTSAANSIQEFFGVEK